MIDPSCNGAGRDPTHWPGHIVGLPQEHNKQGDGSSRTAAVKTPPDSRSACERRHKGKMATTTCQEATTTKSKPGHMAKTTTKHTRAGQVATMTDQEATTTKFQPGHTATKNTKTKMQVMAGQVTTSMGQEATTTKMRPGRQQTNSQAATTATGKVATKTETIPGQVATKLFPHTRCLLSGCDFIAQKCHGKGSSVSSTGKGTSRSK